MSKKSIIIIMSLTFLIALSVCAKEYELTFKAVHPASRAFYMAGQNLQALSKPEEELSAIPELKSRIPIYISVALGNVIGKYTLILDETNGTGTGYNVLYVDSNNNKDLTDDSVIPLYINSETKQFGPIEVMIKYDDVVEPYYFYLEYQKIDTLVLNENSNLYNNIYLRLVPGGYYTGIAKIGNSTYMIGAVDFNGNGIFDEPFNVKPEIKSPDGRLYAIGDKIQMAVGVRREISDFDFYPYSKYIQIGGKWYSVNIASDGRMMEINEADLDLGTLRVPYQLNSIQLVSENGIMTIDSRNILDPKGKITYEYEIPTGNYKIFAYIMQTNLAREKWYFNASGTESVEQFSIENGKTLDLKLGVPFAVNISCFPLNGSNNSIKAGDTVLLSLFFSGRANEVFTLIGVSSKQLPRPVFKAVDENGEVVAKGTFEYG